MIFLLVAVAILYCISFGYGASVVKKFNITELKCQSSIGFLVLLALCQLCYFPFQIINGPFYWIAMITFLWILVGIGLFIQHRKAFFDQFRSRNIYIVGINGIIFLVIFYFCFIDIEFSDSVMYLNYASQNINIEQLNLFNLYTGLTGSEWDTIYLYQGYYHFIAAFVYFINFPYYLFNASVTVETLPAIIWGMGLLYQLVSSGFILDMLDDLRIRSRILKWGLILFTLFYTNYYYWKVSFAFYGNTWRSLIIWVVMWLLYKYIKSNYDTKYESIIRICLFAGLASSSSFFFISFELMFAFFIYLLVVKKENVIYRMANLVIPIVVYAALFLYKNNAAIGVMCASLAFAYYFLRDIETIKRWIDKVDNLLVKYGKWIFIIGLPLCLIVLSIFIKIKNPDYIYDFDYWMQDHQRYDMVKDYRFMYANSIDNILTAIRYIGLAVIVFKYRSKYKWILVATYTTLVIFINPFATEAISKLLTGNVFYRSIEIVFNPFTESIFIIAIASIISKRLFNLLFATVLTCFSAIGHVASFVDGDLGLYTFYINGGKTVNNLFKIRDDELDIIYKFRYVLDEKGRTQKDGSQVTVLSHVNGLRVFEPSLYQIFTPRDYFYPYSRIDDTFYQLATNHYDWIEYDTGLPYENSCDYLYEYGVDYLLVKYDPYYQNYQFDDATNMCSITLISNETYKIKEVVRN